MANKYSDYFEVNEEYFPCFDESALQIMKLVQFSQLKNCQK